MSLLARPNVGGPAPQVALVDANGDAWHLTDRRGRTQVMVFHRHLR